MGNQNIESWIIGSFVYGDKGRPEPNGTDPKVSVNSGMSGMMYRNWIQAGLNWTDEMTTRSEKDTSVQKVYLGAGMTIRGTWVLSTLSGNRGSSNTATGDAFEVSLANNVDGRPMGTTNKTGHLTIEEAYLAGYWPVTKQVIDADGRQRSTASNPTEDVLHHSQPVKVRSQNAHPDAHVD